MPDLTPEQEQDIARFITRLAQFEAGEIEECPHCGATVKSMQKVGRCVYSHPCGCRLWQGEIPPAWQKKQEVRHAK